MPDWSQNEVQLTVEDYFDMLGCEIRGEDLNKAERHRQLATRLDNRTAKAVGRKHSNISAVLVEMGLPFIDGYKPLPNYQNALRNWVCGFVEQRPALVRELAILAGANDMPEHAVVLPAEVLSEPPDMLHAVGVGTSTTPEWRRYNILDIEARNLRLCDLGERFVAHFERRRLVEAGRAALAEAVHVVDREQGFERSHSVESFDEDGSPRVISVKTTSFCRSFPFLVSRNEAETASQRPNDFWLYRVFGYRHRPRLFVLQGSMSDHCRLEIERYRVDFGSRVA